LILKTHLKALTLAMLCGAVGVFAQTYSATQNPKITQTAVPNSSYPYMGLAFLSDGRALALGCALNTSSGNGAFGQGYVTVPDTNQALYLVSGLSRTGSMAGVTFTRILDSMSGPPPGVVVVNDTVYVMDRFSFYRVKSLSPATGLTSVKNNAVRIIDVPTLDSTFAWNRGPTGHQWIFTPTYLNGRFYGAYSGSIIPGGTSNAPPTSTYSGALLSWSKDSIIPVNAPVNSGYVKVAGGIRSPNGLATNGEYLIHSDNQGSFNPGSPLRLYKPGQPVVTYGTRQTTTTNAAGATSVTNTLRNWAEDLPYQPPLIWVQYELMKSTSQPLYLSRGPYKGYWVVGDVNAAGMARLFVDNVDGTNYQGSLVQFTGTSVNGGKAFNRLALSPDSAIYVGTSLTIGNWPSGAAAPMQRLVLSDTTVFEVLAMRSRKSASGDTNGVELFFSQPVDPATVTNSAFTLQQQNFSLGGNYGCNGILCQTKTPVVTGVTVSNDKRKVFVGIATPDTSIGAAHIGTIGVGNNPRGMWGGPGAQDRTLRVVIGTALKSQTGSALYASSVWMGWHFQSTVKFNPANADLSPVGQVVGILPQTSGASKLASSFSLRTQPGVLDVRVDVPGKITVSVYSLSGALKSEQTGSEASYRFDTRSYGRGMHIVRVKSAGAVTSRTFLP
jgi:hypothetical protein